jgi:hypothetical protein
MLGIAEFGFIFQRYEVITNAAREGARIAVLPRYGTLGGYQLADVKARVESYVSSGRVPTTTNNPAVVVDDVSIPVPGGRPPISARRVTVTYTYSYQFLNALSGFFGTYSTVPLRAVSEMRTEG